VKCYHSTTKDRVESIMQDGLLPNSEPTWFISKTPYVMLSLKPWVDLNGIDTVVLEVEHPEIKVEMFNDPEGLRWDKPIPPEYIAIYTVDAVEANLEEVDAE